MGPLCPSISQSATLLGCLVCVVYNYKFSFILIQNLHNDCSYIEVVTHLFYAHFINIFSFLRGVER